MASRRASTTIMIRYGSALVWVGLPCPVGDHVESRTDRCSVVGWRTTLCGPGHL